MNREREDVDKENDFDFQPLKKRFAKPKSCDEMEEVTRGYIPPNTIKNTSNVFKD